jgi:hypothetical protein
VPDGDIGNPEEDLEVENIVTQGDIEGSQVKPAEVPPIALVTPKSVLRETKLNS